MTQTNGSTKKKQLKTFGKNRREINLRTVYDEKGNWVTTNHQDALRQIPCPSLDNYYRDLQQLRTPEEWNSELALFRQPLPTTIWINDTDPLATKIRSYMESLDRHLVEPISWYPLKGMAWRILADKAEFRKRPEMKELRQFLIQQTALGTISRQEEVSMLPPFLLDIQPTDRCLDMCASPGSKTAQMLVALGRHKVVPFDSNASPFPFDYESEGLVIANDLDIKRANMLVHQVKRLRLLFPFALFTNHDARFFPDTLLSSSNEELRFDKILCDVVCSGDGTLRKAPHVFRMWSPREALKLQRIQVQIALRACHLLRVGGRLVYSTCSMNPIENEAVVAQIVHRTRGAMRLVDARALLPDLICSHGLQRWVVTNAKGEVAETPSADAHEALFPPNTPGAYASEAVDKLDLTLCMRLFPSHCNGGAFFIAVLDKVSEFRLQKRDISEDEDVPEGEESGSRGTVENQVTPVKRPRLDGVDNEKDEVKKLSVPPQYVAAPASITSVIQDFYRIDNFPVKHLVVRTANGQRELNLTNGSTCSIVSRSALDVLHKKTDALRVVSAGLRVLAHEHLDNGWRIANESAILFAKFMENSPRTLKVSVPFIESLLAGGKLKDVPFEDINDESLRAQVQKMELGTILLRIDCPGASDGVFYSVALRARKRIQLLVDHEDVDGLKLRLGITLSKDEVPPENQQQESS